jgi:hypothetical protein
MINMKNKFKVSDLTEQQLESFQKALNPAATAEMLKDNVLPNEVRQMFIDGWENAIADVLVLDAGEVTRLMGNIRLFETQIKDSKIVAKTSVLEKVKGYAKSSGEVVKDTGKFVRRYWLPLSLGALYIVAVIAEAMANRNREEYTIHITVDRE